MSEMIKTSLRLTKAQYELLRMTGSDGISVTAYMRQHSRFNKQ